MNVISLQYVAKLLIIYFIFLSQTTVRWNWY